MVTLSRACLALVSMLFLSACSDDKPDINTPVIGEERTPASSNVAPLITSTAVTTATEGQPYTYQVSVNDPDDRNNGSGLSWQLLAAPAGMQISSTGLITWTPENGIAIAPVRVVVRDGGENGARPAEQTFVIVVTPVNDAPTITSVAPTSAVRGNPYQYALVVADPDDSNNGVNLQFELLQAPVGMTISATGVIQWTPPAAGVSEDVSVRVRDGGEDGAAPAVQNFTINVVGANTPPQITSAPVTAASEDVPYQYSVQVTDAEDANNGADLAFTLLEAPAGMTISPQGVIDWTPPENGAAPWTADVEVQVADGGEDGSLPDTQFFSINVTPVNDAPTVTSMPSTSAIEGAAYQYQLVINDPDDANNGTDLQFSLLDAPADMTISATGLISWTAGSSNADVEVQVTDGGEDGAAPATQSWTIVIDALNDAPQITSTAPTTATEGQLYEYAISVDDPDDANNGTDLSFALLTAPTGMTISPTGVISWTPGEGGATAWQEAVQVKVADGGENGAAPAVQSWIIDVTPVNNAPQFVDVSPQLVTMSEDGAPQDFALTLNATDADNSGGDMSWSIATPAAHGTASVSGNGFGKAIDYVPNADYAGADSFVVEISDGELSAQLTVDVTVTPVNDAPQIISVAPTSASEGTLYQYALQITDVDDANDGTALQFSLLDAPAGMTVSSTGVIQWTPADGVASADVSVQVTDGGEDGAAPAVQSWIISVTATNSAPVITQGDSINVLMSEDGVPTPFAVSVDATDADAGTTLTWDLQGAASNGVASASGTGSTPLISYAPNANFAGNDSFVVRVSDGEASDSITINVNVAGVNDAPSITSTAVTTATEGVAYQYSAQASDVDGPALAWTLSNAPAGMTINSSSGAINWLPGEGGVALWQEDVTVQVSDGALTDSQTFTISVTPVNNAPTITSTPSTSATEAEPYSYQLVVADSDDSNNGTDISFVLTDAPAGMTVSSTGLVQWTPPAGIGSANVSVEVSDGGEDGAAAATQSWTISVDDSNDAPTITSVAPTSATEGSEYSYQLVVNDPDDANNGSDLSFSLTQAPSGMNISATGLVTWTPENGISSANVSVEVSDGGENGAAPATQSWTITVDAVNDAPVISEGDSINVSMSEDGTPTAFALTLNATDIDSSTLTWSVATAATNGTAVASGTGNSKAIQYTPNTDYVGTDSFVVRVSDGELNDEITVNVTISNENDAPVITSAAVITASEDVPYQYGVTADDIDGDTLSWSLTQAPAGMNIDASTGVIRWTPAENGASDWSADVTVQVSDGSLTDSQSFSISVAAINDAPLISSSPSTSGIEGEQYSYQITIIDPDDSNNGTDISFTLVQGPAGMAISPTGLLTWTPAQGDTSANVEISVADGGENGAAAATQNWIITIDATNDAPTITSVAPTTATEGSEYSYQLAVNDPDDANNGTDLSFTLTQAPTGMTVSATGLVTWTPGNGVSSADVTVEVADGGEGGVAPATQAWTITVDGVNDAPVITEGNSVNVSMSEDGAPTAFALTLNATDIDSSTLTWSILTAATSGTASASGTGNSKAINYVPAADFNGNDTFVVRVSDGELHDDITVNVTIEAVNDAPLITSTPPLSAAESVLYQYQASASDVDGPSATWSLLSGPVGMSVSSTGLVQWTPPENGADPWTANVQLQVSDGDLSATQNFTIAVTPENNAPVISEGSSVNVTMSEDSDPTAFALTLNATDADSTTLTWSVFTAAGNGTAVASGTGNSKVIQYTPNADYVGSDSFVVRVSDGTLSDDITVNVTIESVNDAPTITSTAITSATEGQAYQYTATADDNDGDTLNWSLTTAPAGMTIDPASGVIDWLPGEGGATAWNETVTVEVSDGTDTATQSFSISVTPVNNAPTITSTAPLSAVEGALYQYTVAVNDSDDANNGTDLAFVLTTAPSGMTISPTGVISWTPPNGVSSADVTVQVSDGGENGATAATQSWTITVGDVNDAPVITSAAPTSATEGQPYSYQVVVNDPDDANNGTDLAFSLTTSPAGMTISSTGAISWTPGENGAASWTADVTVQVADGGENGVAPATQSFTINVTPVNNAPEISEGESVSVSMSEDGTPTAFALTLNVTDADSATLTWSVTSAASNGTAVATGTGNSKAIQYTPNADFVGSDSFVVRVSDGELNDEITVNVTINDENDAPVITSTPNTSATEDVLYQYSASSSDVDGPSVTWSLTQAPAGMTVSSSGLVQWTPGENGTAPWIADVTLQVSDGTLSDSQSFTINVAPVNDAPTITSSAVTTATEEQAYSYQLVVNDPDDSNNGTDLTFSLTQAPSGMTISATGLIEWTPAEGVTDADVTVEVADGGENGVAPATQTFAITVTQVNDAPTITSVAPTSATEAVLYSYQLVVNDPDDSNNGTDLAFSLTQAPSGMTISATGLIEWTPADGVTSANVAVEVTDGGEDGAAAATQSWTINVTAVNDAPVISEGDSVNVTMSEDGAPTAFALVLNATDGDSTTLSWSIASAAANGTANVTGTGNSKAISYTPTADFNGSDSFVVRVSDGSLSDDITVNVTIEAVNDAPSITSTPSTSATEGTPYQYNASASDVDSATLTWTLLTSPAGMTINATTGAISWTPGEGGASAWSESVSVRVSDGEETDTQNFSITVTPVNNAPVISEGSSTSVSMSEDGAPTAFALTLNATDSDSATLTWSIASAATNGTANVTGTGSSKAISYTPTADFNGSDSFVVRVSDGSLNDDITVNVTVQAVNDAPVISSSAPLSADEGIEYNYDVAATDVDSATLTYSLTTAPSGMSIDANSGAITWTPGDGGSSPWTADVTVSVTDGSDSATQSFTITVTPELPVVGRVMKGVLANATVEAALYDAGNWITLATTTTNADGRFGFDLPPQSAPVRIRATTTVSSLMTCDAPAGCDTALFGETVVPAVDLTLDTIVPGAAFAGPIAVTPLTNMAAQWLADLPGGINNDVILLANRRIADLFGMDENFIYQRPVDVTDAAEVAAASGDSNRMRHALFAAGTQQLATNQAMALDTVTRGLAQMFSILGGQMLLQTGAIDLTELGLETDTTTVNYVGLDEYITAATQVANQVSSGGALDALIAALPNLVDRWGGRALSALGEGTGYSAANFARAMGPLDDFDYYYGLAEAAEAGIDETNRSVGWLYVDETAQTNTSNMVTAFSSALGLGFKASICVPNSRNSLFGKACEVETPYTTNLTSCTLSNSTCKFTISGAVDGQTVNLTIPTTPDIRYLLGGSGGSPAYNSSGNSINLCYNGTISNSTAVMTLSNFCINPNLSNNDMSDFEGMSALNYTNETMLNNALEALVADLYIALNLSGNMTIASTNPAIGSYVMQNMDGGFTFNRRVITQDEGGPLMTLNLKTLQRTNPAGETLFNLSGTDMFNLSLGDTTTLHIANGADDLGTPPMHSITDGTVTGLEPLNDVISDYLVSMIDTTVPAPEVDWDQVMLDLENVVISGTSTMEIPADNKLYTFTLNTDGTVDVSQVNSLNNAMTIDLKGVAGYIYADETLVGTGHLGNSEDGLLISLVDDTQRSYANANPSATSQLDGLIALFQQLFPPAEETTP